MASPFSVFRKRQKLWMAITCLLAIVAFVFLPNMGSLLGRGREGQRDLVVVETKKYGDLRLSDLATLRWEKQKVRGVLIELKQALVGDSRAAEMVFDENFGPVDDDRLIDTWLRVRRAQELGMTVSEESIRHFLEGWTESKVPLDKIQAAIRRTGITDAQFFDLLRSELLAQRLVQTFVPSVFIGNEPIATPSQRWDWWNRINRMAVIEAVPFAVANYIDGVKAPGDKVLEDFFEENKDRVPNPVSPDPGFRRPQKVAIEYFKADLAQFAAKVGNAEVLKEYENNKEEYDRRFRIPPPRRPAGPALSNEPSNTKKANEPKPKAEPAAKQKAPQAKSTVVEPKKEQTPKQTPKTPNVEKSKPAADMKQTPPQASPKADLKEPTKTQDSKGASAAADRSPFVLTAFQADKPGDRPTQSSAASQPSSRPAPPKAVSPAVKDQKQTAKEQKPAGKEQKPATKEQPHPAANKPAAEPTADELLDELPDALKKRIRRDIAIGKIQQAFENLRKPVEEYQQECRKYDSEKAQLERAHKQIPPAPSTAALEKLAKQNGLSFDRTRRLSEWEAQATDVGASLIEGRYPVCVYIYKASKYRSEASLGGDAAYLSWKSEDVKEYTPKFDDPGVRDEVLHTWKMIEARGLAKKAAESLADEANRTGKPLKQLLANRPELRLVLPPQFSWLSLSPVAVTSMQRPRPYISTVAGVPTPGEKFMAEVFRLEPGQAGVAFNAPETTAYVVRPSEFTPSYKVRWMLFLKDSFATYESAGVPDGAKVFQAWGEEIKKSVGFKWGPGHKVEQANELNRGGPRSQPTPIDEED